MMWEFFSAPSLAAGIGIQTEVPIVCCGIKIIRHEDRWVAGLRCAPCSCADIERRYVLVQRPAQHSSKVCQARCQMLPESTSVSHRLLPIAADSAGSASAHLPLRSGGSGGWAAAHRLPIDVDRTKSSSMIALCWKLEVIFTPLHRLTNVGI